LLFALLIAVWLTLRNDRNATYVHHGGVFRDFQTISLRRQEGFMATGTSSQQDTPAVRIVSRLGDAFHQLQARVRERAYLLFRDRDPEHGDPHTDWLTAQAQLVTPIALEVKQQKKNIVVEGSLEGFSPDEIEIEVSADQLHVFGSHAARQQTHSAGVSQAQYEKACFYQAIPLPCAVNADGCRAKLYKNGKLSITLPRK
jgi:HSP20 family molecular chaperone IbpA